LHRLLMYTILNETLVLEVEMKKTASLWFGFV